jgi:hypothetical protein
MKTAVGCQLRGECGQIAPQADTGDTGRPRPERQFRLPFAVDRQQLRADSR